MRVGLKSVWLLTAVSLILSSDPGSAKGAADLEECRDVELVPLYKAESGRSAMYAQVTRLRNGDLLCAFRDSKIGPDPKTGGNSPWAVPGSRIMCVRSVDNGKTWSKTPTFIYQDKEGFAYTSQCGLGYQAEDGTVLVPFYVCNPRANQEVYDDPLHQACGFIARSKDNGRTWTCEKQSDEFFSSGFYGGIYRLDDGRLWMTRSGAGYQLTLARAREMSEKGQKRGRGCYRLVESRDDGKNWTHYSCLGYDPTRPEETAHFPTANHLQEPTVVQLPTGKILMITRPYMHRAVSMDRGRTWTFGPSTLTRDPKRKESQPGHQGYSGLCPSIWYTKAGPPSGTLVLAYHDRWGEHANKGGNYISFSHDEGQTWGYPVFIDGGAYPVLYELEKDSGNFMCPYYESSSLLKNAFFSVPFPTGARAVPGVSRSGKPGVTVSWDAYDGRDSEKYEYRVYRSIRPRFELEKSKLVFSGRGVNSYCDETVEPGRKHYYQVAACLDGKIVSRSWHVSATTMLSSGLPYSGMFRFGKHEGYVKIPPDYNPAKAHPFIIYFHGRGGSAASFLTPSQHYATFLRKVTERGYIFATPDYGSDCWMNREAEAMSLEMIAFLNERLNLDPMRFYVMGGSMGGGGSLTFSMRHKEMVAAVATLTK